MREVTDECLGCTSIGLPCVGEGCLLKRTTHYYCDRCEEEFEPKELYQYEGEEVCIECLLKDFERIEV